MSRSTRSFTSVCVRRIGSPLLAALLALGAGCDAFRSDVARMEDARAAIAAGDFQAASIELKGILDSHPDNAEARLALAETSLALGDGQAADKELRRALAAGLSPQKAAVVQGRVLLALGRSAELLQMLNEGTMSPQEPDRSMLKADALLTVGETGAAEATCRAVLASYPGHARATTGLALSLASQGRETQALELLAAHLKAHPEAGDAWLLRGEILARASRYAEAEAAFSQAASEPGRTLTLPQRVSALTGLADTQLLRGAAGEARETLARMRKTAGNTVQARLIAARLDLVDQDYAAAIAELQPVVTAMPGFAPARFLFGAASLAQGNLEQAESHLAALVEMAPENVEARKLLAKARLRLGRYDGAMQVLTPVMQQDEFDPELSSLLGEAKLRAGAQGEAVGILEQAAARDPGNVGVRLDLATAYIVAGRSAEAVDLLRTLPEVAGDRRRETLLLAALAAAKGPAEVRREIGRLVSQHPEDTRILLLAAAHSSSQAEHATARSYLNRALAVKPADPDLLLALAQTELRAGNLAGAQKILTKLADVPRLRTAARLALVEVEQQRGGTGAVREALERIRADDPGAVAPRLMLARILLTAAETAPAAQVLSEVVAIDPRDATLRLQVARLLGEFGRYDDAMRQVREAVENSPASAEAWTELARLQLARDLPQPARQSAEKAVAIDRNSVEAIGLLALLDVREKRGPSALQRVRELAARRPADPRAALLEGDVLLGLGQPREAAQSFQRAMTLSPSLQIAVKHTAALRASGAPNADAPLAHWVAERPADVRARQFLAESYQTSGRRDLAVEQYERLAAMPAAGFADINNLAWLYFELGDPRAEATARRAYDLAADNPAVVDTYGWVLTRKGKVAEGREALARAVNLAPGNPDIGYHYAAALASGGDGRQAIRLLDQLLAANPAFASRAEAESLRQRLASEVAVGANRAP